MESQSLPQASTDLSKINLLSQQQKASSNRFGRVPTQISQYHGVGDFAAAPIQNVLSGGDPAPARPEPAPVVPSMESFAPPTTPQAPINVDKGAVETTYSPPTSIEGIMGENIGSDLLGNMVGKGLVSGGKTAGLAYALNAPMSVAAPAVLGSVAMSPLNPVGLGLNLGGAAKSGMDVSQIGKGYADIFGQDALDQAVAANAQGEQPKSLEAQSALALAKGFEPKGLISAAISDESVSEKELKKAKHILSLIEGPFAQEAQSEFSFNQNPEAMTSLSTDLEAANAPMGAEEAIMGMPAYGQPGGIGGGSIVGSLGPHDVGQGNAPASANTPGAVAQPGLVQSGFSAPQGGEGTTTGNFGGGDEGGSSVSGSGGIGYGGGESGDVGGGGDGDTVICTELYRQGLMPTDIYEADCAFGASLDSDVMEGYQLWGKPVAHAMSKSKLLTMIAKPFVLSWANHMAYGFGGKRTLFGRFALTIGVPICRFIGRRLNKEPQVAVVG